MATSDWTYNGKLFTIEQAGSHVGFVYLITNLLDGRLYVGQKKLTKKVRRKRKNKRDRIESKSSDWQDYFGSNEQLQQDVAKHGADNFTREVLHLCKSKAMMNWVELREQVLRDVLFDTKYYNSYIGGRINRKQLKIAQR